MDGDFVIIEGIVFNLKDPAQLELVEELRADEVHIDVSDFEVAYEVEI